MFKGKIYFIFVILSIGGMGLVSKPSFAEGILPGRCHSGICFEQKIIEKALLKKNPEGTLYSVNLAIRTFPYGSQPSGIFQEPKVSYVYCSTSKPSIVFKSINKKYVAHLLAPGGQSYGYNQSDYPVYWATCHNLFESNVFSSKVTAKAKQLGYFLDDLKSEQIELNNFSEIISLGQRSNSSPACNSAIVKGENRLNEIQNLNIIPSRINWGFISQPDPGQPKNRPWVYSYIMQGVGISNIYSSPVLMSSVSTHIIRNCPSVSMVQFAVYRSGGNLTYGLMLNGDVRQFECLKEPWGQGTAKWGQTWC